MGKDLKGKELGPGLRQRENGKYSARFVDRFGNRKEIYDWDLAELKRRFRKMQYEDQEALNVLDDNMTLDDWFSHWIDVYKKESIRLSSYTSYKNLYNKHISPILGGMKLSKIRNANVTKLLNDMRSDGYSFEVRNSIRILLKDMYNKAIMNECARVNPVHGVRVLRDGRRQVRFLSETERELFFRCSAGTFYDNLFVTAVNSGLRLGELCALTENDIDFDNRIIHVTKTLLYQKLDGDLKKEFRLDPPKTECSYRDVGMNDECYAALKDQVRLKRVIAGREYARTIPEFKDILFITKFDTPINSQIAKEAIAAIINMVNLTLDDVEQLEKFPFHCFRHTFATRCFEAGMQPKVIQTLLGHATLSMTMDLYTHVSNEKVVTSVDLLKGVRE